jgi:hypothetical protein
MCNNKFLKYNFATQIYYAPGEIPLEPWCNGIVVKNNGTTYVIFQGDVLLPGESKSIGGNRKEILQGRVDLTFFLQTPAPGTIINQCTVTQKFYLDPQCEKWEFE